MKTKRVTLFAGHYGSGKTNVAVNYAMYLRSLFDKVLIADLDVVNPYFRTKDSAEELAAAGIHLISPEFANTNVDLPALPTEMYAIVDRTDYHAVVDVGGDDSGAVALGRYVPGILEENDYEMLFVCNRFRPRRCARRNARDRGGVRNSVYGDRGQFKPRRRNHGERYRIVRGVCIRAQRPLRTRC